MPQNKVRQTSPNIVFFLYDSLIGPMLSSFGGKAPTPAFDFFANGGARFDKCAVHSLRNDIAMGSILTGKYPNNSGIHTLELSEGAAITRKGHIKEGVKDLAYLSFESGYRVRAFNCTQELAFMPRVMWFNAQLNPPHVGQLMDFINESKPGPFLIIDRFETTAFPWRPDLPCDRRETDKEHRGAALAAMASNKAKSLVIRRMQDAAMREDARLMRIINLLNRHSLIDNTIVVISGIPGNLNEREKAAINVIHGLDGASPPAFPLVIWYPKKVAPTRVGNGIVRHVDIMPTILKLAGIEAPEGIDGYNLLPAIAGKEPLPQETLTFYDDRIKLSGLKETSEIRLEASDTHAQKPEDGHLSMPVYRAIGSPSVLPRRNDSLLGGNVIPKRSVFVIGNGRSGTQFFSKFFQRPDFSNVLCNGHLWPRMLHDMHILYSSGLISREQVKKNIFEAMREVTTSSKEVFVCVSHDCMFITDILAEVFPNSVFVLLARDPRKLLVSLASTPWILQTVEGHSLTPIDPLMLKVTVEHWNERFTVSRWIEQWCKAWEVYMRDYHDAVTGLGDRGAIVRFEDIFSAKKGFLGVKQMAEFVKDLFRIPVNDEWLKSVFSEKVNSYPTSFPKWKDWDEKDREVLSDICGETMKLFGYNINSDPE